MGLGERSDQKQMAFDFCARLGGLRTGSITGL